MSLATILLIMLLLAVFYTILRGVPVMFALLGIALLVAVLGVAVGVFDAGLLSAIPNRILGVITNQLLYAVPLFVLMGKLLEHSGLAAELLTCMARGFKNHKMSLAYCVLGVSVILAASSGIVGATITMLAAIAVPTMLKNGYSEKFSAGLVCACGALGQILPPSIVLILLSDQVSNAFIVSQLTLGNFSPDPVSVGHLFAASIIPGLILAFCYACYIAFGSRQKSTVYKPVTANDGERNHPVYSLLILAVTLLTLISIPLSIILGIASASESAIIGVVLLIFILLVKKLNSEIFIAFRETIEITGVIFGIIVGASVFSLVLRGLGGDEAITSLFQQLPGEAYGALFVVMLIVFLLGFFIEFIEITYIVVPVTAPILFGLGIDPIWFAMLMAVNLQISFLTPPLGIALFYYKTVQTIAMKDLAVSIIPFVLIQIFVLGLIVVFPDLATWLPRIIF